MRSDLDKAFDGEPWSFAGVVFGLELIRDDEGRPISERRAPSLIKDGVPMELRSCPYSDERRGQPMNVSALAQIKRHLDAVLDEIARFRATSGGEGTSWADVFRAVTDQLSAPARYLLETRSRYGPVPARSAVGHKLAAGYFDVFRKLLAKEARGDRRTVSVENLLAFVTEERALIGASEVCAGPPKLIARVSETLVHGNSTSGTDLPVERASIAGLLALQIQVGIAWELLDLESERRFLIDEIGRSAMQPRNPFIERKLDERVDELMGVEPLVGTDSPMLPPGLAPDHLTRLESALRHPEDEEWYPRACAVIKCLFSHREGAIAIERPDAMDIVASSFARYLATYREFVHVQSALEEDLRKLLGFSIHVPIALHPTILPKPKGLDWYEVVLGHRLYATSPPATVWTLGNHLRRASIA